MAAIRIRPRRRRAAARHILVHIGAGEKDQDDPGQMVASREKHWTVSSTTGMIEQHFLVAPEAGHQRSQVPVLARAKMI